MFGNHNDDAKNNDNADQTTSSPPLNTSPSDPLSPGNSSSDSGMPPPPAGFGPVSANEPDLDDLAGSTEPNGHSEPAVTAPSAPAPDVEDGQDDLLSIKQEALQKLSPLVGHLDQTPEEKFKTTMMMIQATDDKSKVQEAYEAAQAITDEKVRAQALLDVVNEINYFTTKNDKD